MTIRRGYRILAVSGALLLVAGVASAQNPQWKQADTITRENRSMFRALEDWPAPNEFRSATGAPGRRYWQQQVDYVIKARLDTVTHRLHGSERITYHNNSPDTLTYLWFQLDQNQTSKEHSRSYAARAALPQPAQGQTLPPQALAWLDPAFDGGDRITRVQLVDRLGKQADAKYLVNGTQMRVNLAQPLAPGAVQVLDIDWNFEVPNGGRGAKEKLKDGWIYLLAQWFPRATVYDDINGWQNDQFLGQGEFYLEFGNYDVSITVPRDHIVNATGVLLNPLETLTAVQRQRLTQALTDTVPVMIVRPDEVMTPGARPAGTGPVTWHFKAERVRDFAIASSKLFVWDAAGFRYSPAGRRIEMSSFYPREAMPLWDKVSTRAIRQTLVTYGRMALEYPYPRATNVHGPVGGMEYPMVAFCGVRPNDGKYTQQMEHALVSVSIHEVGHNWFPMIVASDERKWTWMDEGLNSFVQHYAEMDWSPDFPAMFGTPKQITGYMRNFNQAPLMTHSDQVHRGFQENGYTKPAAGLVILRETILGPERFDLAFRDYARRWAFRKPQPQDFFRSMEDGAGENLSWYWRGWFYTTHANDQAITDVTTQPAQELIGNTDRGTHYNRVKLRNAGGLVMPVLVRVTLEDGTVRDSKLPVEIWRNNENEFTWGFFSSSPVLKVELDPEERMADVNVANNVWQRPTRPVT